MRRIGLAVALIVGLVLTPSEASILPLFLKILGSGKPAFISTNTIPRAGVARAQARRATPAAPLTRTSMGGAPWRLVFSRRFRIIRRSRRESPRR